MNSTSTNLVTTYLDFAYVLLEDIPFTEEIHFKMVNIALKNLLKNREEITDLPENIRCKISLLRKLIQNPAVYIEKTDFCNEFSDLIKNRIQFKRGQINSLNPIQKRIWINECKLNLEKSLFAKTNLTTSAYQEYRNLLSEQSGEIIKIFHKYLKELEVIIGNATGDSVDSRCYFHINPLVLQDLPFEKLNEFKNKTFELPNLQKNQNRALCTEKIIKLNVYNYLNALAEIGLIGVIVFTNS